MKIKLWIISGIVLYVLNAVLLFAEIVADSNKNVIVTGTLEAGGFITTEKKAHLSGIRIEPLELGDDGFVGYTDKGISIVHPEIHVRVVFFGWWLDEVILIGFTKTDNCSNTLMNVPQGEFTIQTEKRLVIKYQFHADTKIFKVCMKQKDRELKDGRTIVQPYVLMDDLRTSVSTDLPPRKYYFPIMVQISIVAFLLVLSGLFSGLNLGLMALSPQELMLISKSGSKRERKYAETILPVRKSGNLLLCSLLIGNVCVNSAISILFDDLTSGYIALIVSSAGIVVFGEIFPQSLCVKKGLAVGARTIWITRFFMVLTFPLAYPISRILDCVLGDEVVSYDRKRLMELIKMSTRDDNMAEELKIAVGAMEISDKTVSDVMTKIDDVFMLSENTVLNAKTVAEILRMGYTRIPVYSGDRNSVVSLLFVKDLALLDPDDNFTVKVVSSYHEHALRFVAQDTPLRVMLEEFKKGDYHLAMVHKIVQKENSDPNYELVGIVTLEDIVEEILQAEIVDETDAITDNVHRRRRPRADHDNFGQIFMENTDNANRLISLQLHLVAMQWLTTNQGAFHQDLISPNVLERLIRQHVHKVELSHLADVNDSNMVYPRISKLFTKDEPSDKFILILEGRAIVNIGQNEMTFEAGPWQCFGSSMLDKLVTQIKENQKTIQQGVLTKEGSRSSQGALLPIISSGAKVAVPEIDPKKISFTPDFSATIRDDCTYLEISAQTYLLAYKSSLLGKAAKQCKRRHTFMNDRRFNFFHDLHRIDGPLKYISSIDELKKITSHGQIEEEAPFIRNGSLKKPTSDEGLNIIQRKRSNSESSTRLLNSNGEANANNAAVSAGLDDASNNICNNDNVEQ